MVQPIGPGRTPFPSGQAPPATPGASVTLPVVQPSTTLPTQDRQYPNVPEHWFKSKEAHGGMKALIRTLYDMNYDLQDGIKLLTTSNPGLQVAQQALQGSGAVNPSQRANYLISAPAAAALTLGAPRVGIDDGTELTFTSSTGQTHSIQTPGLLQTGSAAINTVTWPAFKGGSLHLRAWQGFWQVMSSNGVSFS